ncbi:MAG: L-seryl-tRNA(Sec) selenium transferase [Dissulfurispiraceae bacterium]
MDKKDFLSSLPSVDELLKSQDGMQWQQLYPRPYVLQAIRETIQQLRDTILRGERVELSLEGLSAEIAYRAERLSAFSLRSVINATGVVIHTNLGRSVLSKKVLDHVVEVASGYSNLEYDTVRGKRGKRYSHIQKLLREITDAEDSLIVNNNAAAVFVCLNTLAKGREVIVSRGELVEIGGSFRIPDVMNSSGAVLREVGTTNKTHVGDYEAAINDNTALLLKVHQSNFRIVGFTKALSADELVTIGKKHTLPVMFDLGSGCLLDFKPYGIQIEPTVQEMVKAGIDIVTFSGDKLLGGPQGGIIVGRAEIIEKIAKNPLMRAIRVDKMTLAAFEATLMQYLDEDKAKSNIPTLGMLFQEAGEIRKRAKKIVTLLKRRLGVSYEEKAGIGVLEDTSQSGGGALSEIEFQTYAVSVQPLRLSVDLLAERLRHNRPPIIARIKEDALLLDARTVSHGEIDTLVKGLVAALG